ANKECYDPGCILFSTSSSGPEPLAFPLGRLGLFLCSFRMSPKPYTGQVGLLDMRLFGSAIREAMIKIVLLEFEDTLITSASVLYPGVMGAFSTLQKFETDDQRKLLLYLFSLTPEMWRGTSDRSLDGLRARLDALGMSSFFDPIGEHVVVVGEDDVTQRGVLDAVLSHSSFHASLDEIVLVSGSQSVSHAIEQNKLRSFRFSQSKRDGSNQFSDWAELPLLLANLFDSARQKNLEIALRSYLSSRQNLSLASLRPSGKPD